MRGAAFLKINIDEGSSQRTLTSSYHPGSQSGKDTIIDGYVLFSLHAEKRCAQRNLSEHDVLYVLEHGRTVHAAGSKMFFLARRDVPKADRAKQQIQRLIGVCVHTRQVRHGILLVTTLYHNAESGLKDQRRKRKYDRRKAVA
ncbi:MAG: DUF4258 domain-containing protein [Chloroflexota bacterium]